MLGRLDPEKQDVTAWRHPTAHNSGYQINFILGRQKVN